MDSSKFHVSLDDFKLFHGIDRELYTLLVQDLNRNHYESLQTMGLWLWLERGSGSNNIIRKILSLPIFLINELADEATTCINCINNGQYPFPNESSEIPLTQSLVKKEFSLQFLYQNRQIALQEIQDLVKKVLLPALADIMEKANRGKFRESQFKPAPHSFFTESWTQNFFNLMNNGQDASSYSSRFNAIENEASRNDRTMFVTFSKGYPVSESEVRLFFSRMFGNCIESFHMQEVGFDEQSLYARVIFLRSSIISVILDGVNKAKFTINGKHVWMRKFVPKNGRGAFAPSSGPR